MLPECGGSERGLEYAISPVSGRSDTPVFSVDTEGNICASNGFNSRAMEQQDYHDFNMTATAFGLNGYFIFLRYVVFDYALFSCILDCISGLLEKRMK